MANQLFNKGRVWLSSPHMSGEEKKYIAEAFESNWVAPLGPNVDNFETELAKYLSAGNVTALSSGTAGIHLGLIILGVKPGDEVIVSSFTFSASVNPITYLGGTPVLIDSEEQTWNMDPELLEKAIKQRISNGRKPKAIVVVHLYGMPARMKELMSIAEKYEIPILEDAAEALGSKIDNKSCGTFGAMGVLSFNGNKIITTSGGGALISDNSDYINKARFLSTQARDKAPYYQHSQIGYNYRMSNILAGIGRGQLEVLDQRVEKRRYNFNFYREALKNVKAISFIEEHAPNHSNRWLTTILVDENLSHGVTNEDIKSALDFENIETRHLWKPMHMQPVFSYCPAYISGVSERLFKKGLCLPSGSNLTDDNLNRITNKILELFR